MRHRKLRTVSDLFAAVLITLAIPAGLLALLFHQPVGRAVWATRATSVLLVIATLAWVLLLTGLLRGIWAHLHHRGSFDSRLNRFAARIAIALSLTFGLAGAASASVNPTHVAGHHVVEQAPASSTPVASRGAPHTTYTVRDGDCLWTIAEAFYGDGRRYGAILEANFGQVFGRGERFDNPRIIRTGWVLVLPHLTPSAPSRVTQPTPSSSLPHAATTTPSTSSHPATRKTTERALAHHGSSATPPVDQASRTAVAAVAAPANDDDLLQSVGALGLGLLAGAVATRRRRTLVDDEGTDTPHSCEVDAALRLGDLAVRGGLVHAVIAQLEATGRIHPLRSATIGEEALPEEAQLPGKVALVLGLLDRDTQVAVVERGTTVTVAGPHRQGLVALQRLLASTWGDELGSVATTSATFAADHVALQDPRSLLYFGNVEDLEPQVAAQSVIVTEQLGGDLVVNVFEQETQLGTGATLSTLFVTDAFANEVAPLCGIEQDLAEGDQLPSSPVVRLLTPMPRIEGLANDLDKKRARRAVELAAFLSLHRSHLVTGGQLRTELLGDSESDGSTKSLSNTVSALRRSLGVNGEGDLHLPPATRSGCYGLHPSVSSDYEQALHYLDAAKVAQGDSALALVRAAAELIEGKPLASCVLGFDWFFREGLDRVLARALSHGVESVMDHAIAQGHVALARMLIDKATLVNPYSETLARAAMSLAAASNDVDQLQQEWNGHLRRLEELEPGLSPSAMTEAHFWRLHGLCSGTLTS